jgi:hypothetical protein
VKLVMDRGFYSEKNLNDRLMYSKLPLQGDFPLTPGKAGHMFR